MNPYAGYKVYGPYLHSIEGRYYVQLVKPGHRTTTSYSRYIMSIHLGRILGSHEEVDHKDDNKLNDSLENLQLLSKQENRAKNRTRTMVELTCPNCGVTFIREKRRTHLTKGGKFPTCCSRTCARKNQHATGGSQVG